MPTVVNDKYAAKFATIKVSATGFRIYSLSVSLFACQLMGNSC